MTRKDTPVKNNNNNNNKNRNSLFALKDGLRESKELLKIL